MEINVFTPDGTRHEPNGSGQKDKSASLRKKRFRDFIHGKIRSGKRNKDHHQSSNTDSVKRPQTVSSRKSKPSTSSRQDGQKLGLAYTLSPFYLRRKSNKSSTPTPARKKDAKKNPKNFRKIFLFKKTKKSKRTRSESSPRSQSSSKSLQNLLGELQGNLKKYKCSLDPMTLKIAGEQLCENPKTRNEKILELHMTFCRDTPVDTLINYKHHLTDPVFLLRFLRVAKFDVNLATTKLAKWIALISGGVYEEIPKMLKDKEAMIRQVLATRTSILPGAIDSSNFYSSSSSSSRDRSETFLVTYQNSGQLDRYTTFKEFALDTIAVSILEMDYLVNRNEFAQVLGVYYANIITEPSSAQMSPWYLLKNFKHLTKMLRTLSGDMAVRNRGLYRLNDTQSWLGKGLEKIIDPLLTEKLKGRRKKFGADWIKNRIFDNGKIPKRYGGELDDEEGVRWIYEHFGVSQPAA